MSEESKPQSSPEMVALARQVLDTTYKLADGTVLSAGTTAMRTDLSTLAWGVIRLQEQQEALQARYEVVLASAVEYQEQLETAHRNMDRYGMALAQIAAREGEASHSPGEVARAALAPNPASSPDSES